MLLSRFLINTPNTAPLFLAGLSLCSSFIVVGGALLSTARNFGKFPSKIAVPALAGLGCLLSFIAPFLPYDAAKAIILTGKILKCVCLGWLCTFIGFTVKNDKNGVPMTLSNSLIAVLLLMSVFMKQIYPAQANPIFWLCALVTLITFADVFFVFLKMKQSNSYLTENLHKEVESRLKDIKSIIQERDKLLQFVSHDMKKPISSSLALLETAIARESDPEQIKTLKIIKQYDARVVENLSEISGYAKFNYIAEPSQVVDLCPLLQAICAFHSFDCNANGIVLKNNVEKSVKVFVKPQGLENAVSNIIMNAVEHANCKNITLSVKYDKKKVLLQITDDGKGIAENVNVFTPYVTEKEDSGGVGLFICKSIIESMNGELTYRCDDGTSFIISLPRA